MDKLKYFVNGCISEMVMKEVVNKPTIVKNNFFNFDFMLITPYNLFYFTTRYTKCPHIGGEKIYYTTY